MNRIIKFRGKRTDNGGWVYGYLIEYNVIRAKGIAVGTVNMSCECEVSCRAYRVIPATVGQFTGLCDRNGKEIYEGDILFDGIGLVFPVTVNDYHGFRFMFGKDMLYRAVSVYGEVSGNLHDNPDLLTAK